MYKCNKFNNSLRQAQGKLSIVLLLSLGFNLLLPQKTEAVSIRQVIKSAMRNEISEFKPGRLIPILTTHRVGRPVSGDEISQDEIILPPPLESVEKKEKVISKKWVIITAYSSTPDQTDSTPFITASNTYVYDGVVAANFLPFGTKIKIPSLFGDKIFTVEDRMKSNKKVDIWFSTRREARNFGIRRAEIEILEDF